MIGVDASVLISFLNGDNSPEVERFVGFLAEDKIVLPPCALTEALSDPRGSAPAQQALSGLTVLPVIDGYWQRAGQLRSAILRAGAKAKLGDCLIAQSCLDAGLPLLTRDGDFQAIARVSGLELA